MAGSPGLTPEDLRAAQERKVRVIIKNDAGQVQDNFTSDLLEAAHAVEYLPLGWSADVTDI